MSSDNFIDVKIMGREYRVSCTPQTKNDLQQAVIFVDHKMNEIAAKTRNTIPERIAVMAALNIAHELISGPSNTGAIAGNGNVAAELDDMRSRVHALNARIDGILKSDTAID